MLPVLIYMIVNMSIAKFRVLFVVVLAATMACSGGGHGNEQKRLEEDTVAKRNLQGIWLDDDGEDVAFRVKGDSVYFPDSTSAPSYFRIERDSFVLIGGNEVKYHIVKQTSHLFVFVNQNGERVKLYKTNDNSYLDMFAPKKIMHVNQNSVVKRDTIFFESNNKYHCYVQVNPTTYKVAKASFNDDGVEVDNIYYDNIINLSVYNGAAKVFSRDIRKDFFGKEVSQQVLRQTVLSDLLFEKADAHGISCLAILAIPETSINYIVEVIVGYDGSVTKRIKK